jgi:peptidoglycan/LPS O-acetylase OafA/YrhL
LNAKPLVHIGLISYSLYLWQELFLTPLLEAPNQWSGSILGRFPSNLIAVLLAAELSWQFVEKPALKARRMFERPKSARPELDLDKLKVQPTDSAEIAS